MVNCATNVMAYSIHSWVMQQIKGQGRGQKFVVAVKKFEAKVQLSIQTTFRYIVPFQLDLKCMKDLIKENIVLLEPWMQSRVMRK
jgi:hypothetical protein